MRKRSFLLIAGACLATLSLTIGSAMADPSNPAGPRDLAGTGSDTTQGVMNGLSDVVKINNNKVIASYDATGSAQITTKGTTGSAPCTMNRPSGSGAGIDALVASLAANGGAGDGCLQFARSSKNDSANRGGKNLVYIPFAVDQIGYATKISSSNIPPTLSIDHLRSIYNCQVSAIQPMLPQFSSGTRTTFLAALGFTDASDFTSQTNHTCIKQVDATGAPMLENTGKKLFASNQIIPYSISVFVAQSNGIQTDDHGFTKLGRINDLVPLQAGPSATITRDVYNVVPKSQIGAGTETNTVFVGSGSLVCTNTDVIKRFGFQPKTDSPGCGSTTIQTP
jgi:ABC-type phosphate transport system substrate-binding protein